MYSLQRREIQVRLVSALSLDREKFWKKLPDESVHPCFQLDVFHTELETVRANFKEKWMRLLRDVANVFVKRARCNTTTKLDGIALNLDFEASVLAIARSFPFNRSYASDMEKAKNSRDRKKVRLFLKLSWPVDRRMQLKNERMRQEGSQSSTAFH